MSDLMLVSTRKGLMTYTRNEKGWVHDATHFYGSPVSLALSDKSGQTILAALNLGHFGVKLHRTQDGGKTWTELDPPAYPKADGGESDESAPANKGIWALEWADPQNPNAVWCGTAPGGLFYSDDLGATWTLNRGLWDFEERKKWVGGGTVDPDQFSWRDIGVPQHPIKRCCGPIRSSEIADCHRSSDVPDAAVHYGGFVPVGCGVYVGGGGVWV